MKPMIKPTLWVAAAMLAAASAHAQQPPLTIETVIKDIAPGTLNEAVPKNPNYDWQKKPHIVQYTPHKSSLPTWWEGNRPEWCYGVLSWFTAFEAGGEGGNELGGHSAKNTRIEVRNLRIYMLSNKTRTWAHIDTAKAPDTGLWKYPFVNIGGAREADLKTGPGGGSTFKPAYPQFHHGYGHGYTMSDPADVRGVFVAMEFRLVVDDPALPDDRGNARYVVNVGADYWPGKGQTWGVNYAPGIGSGRYLLAKNDWRTATLLVPNKALGATFDEMRVNPPPLTVPAE